MSYCQGFAIVCMLVLLLLALLALTMQVYCRVCTARLADVLRDQACAVNHWQAILLLDAVLSCTQRSMVGWQKVLLTQQVGPVALYGEQNYCIPAFSDG